LTLYTVKRYELSKKVTYGFFKGKVMKISRSIYSISFLLLGTCISFSYTRSVKRIETPYVISIDPLLSDREQEQVVVAFEHDRLSPTSTLFEKLTHQFPEIKTISMMHHPTGVKKLSITTHAPQARINNELVINEAAVFLPKAIYDHKITEQLINISVPQLPNVPAHDLINFVHTIPQAIYERFSISWMRPTEIWLKDTQCSDFLVACDDQHMIDSQCITQCESVYQKMKESHKRTKKTAQLITDVRFENQIIAYFKEGV